MKCKQTLLIFLFILVPQFFLQAQLSKSISSETVTQKMAQEAARSFLLKEQTVPPQIATKTKGQFIVRNEAAGLELGEIQPITDNNGVVLAYVQGLEPEGFIIISADDAIRSVLGFSFTGKFFIDYNKPNPLLDLVIADVSARRELANVGFKENIEFGSSTQWGPWLQTTWRQGSYWNEKCPYKNPNNSEEGRRPVGCVATAMTQIVNYWQYPQSVEFSEEEHFYISEAYVNFDASGEYGFPSLIDMQNNMSSLLYDGDPNEAAYLSFAAGVKLHMNYGVSQSGANTYSVRDVLNNHFGFGSAIAYTDRSGMWSLHSLEIVEDLKNGWPVQIAIHKSGKRGGHSIVVDGYRDESEFFHLNYGSGAFHPDSISNTWYNIPTTMPKYDVVHTVVYRIAKYKGWNQIGADQRNSYHAIYPVPIEQPERKWPVNIPKELASITTSYSFSHLVIGTGGRIYTSLSPSDLGDTYHPYIAIYDKFGTRENLIKVTHSNVSIRYLSQNSRGEVFFSSGTAGPTTTDSKVYRLNTETDDITSIFAHSSPDAGIFEHPIKLDKDDYLYFVIEPRFSANYAKFYSTTRTGTSRWTPYSFQSTAKFYNTVPAIDEDRDRVYLNYYNSSTQKSHLIAFRRSNGLVVFDEELPTSTHYASAMAGPPGIDNNGTVYVGAFTSLFAYSSVGEKLWEVSFYPAYTNRTPAIGLDGTLYVNYGKMVNNNWQPGYVRALNSVNGEMKWEMSLSLGESDHMSEIYSAVNGIVVYSYDKDGQSRLGGVKDEGSSYGNRWDMEGGGTLAFGPGRTIFSIPPGWNQSIWALTDQGVRGDPDGKGMDYADNSQPLIPSIISPSDGSEVQDTTSVQLSWMCTDPDGHALKYDIYVCALVEGEEAAFTPVASQVTSNSYTLPNLLGGTQYLWSVVATDGQAISEGPVWSFSTKVGTASVQNISLSDMGASASAISEGTYSGNTQYAYYSIDGDQNTIWSSQWSMPAWLKVEFDKVYSIEQVGIWWSSHQHTFSIELSLDDNNWTTAVPSRLSNNSEGSDPVHELFSITSTEAKYIRINIESTSAPSSHIFQASVGELEAYASTLTNIGKSHNIIPNNPFLHQNYPNPFNPSTTFKYELPKESKVILSVFDMNGRLVETLVKEKQQSGYYLVQWNATQYSSGVYIYRIQADGFSSVKKCILMK